MRPYPSSQTPKMTPLRPPSHNEVGRTGSLLISGGHEDGLPTPSNEARKTSERQEETRAKILEISSTSSTWSSYESAVSHTSSLIARSQESSKRLAAESALKEVARERERAYTRLNATSIFDQRPEVIKKTIQELRDEVRLMVANGRPKAGTPLYQGRKQDGSPVVFLKQHYMEYLPSGGQHTLFLHDLRLIDNALARAVEIDRMRTDELIGTKSDMFKAMEAGKFTDGADTKRRLRNAARNKTTRNL